MLESLFSKVALKSLIKKDPNAGIFLQILQNFSKHLLLQSTVADFDLTLIYALSNLILMTRSNKVKVRRANSQNVSSYPVRFRTDIRFCFLFSCYFLGFFLKLIICILIHIRIYGRVSDKNFFTRPVSGHKTNFSLFFCLA